MVFMPEEGPKYCLTIAIKGTTKEPRIISIIRQMSRPQVFKS